MELVEDLAVEFVELVTIVRSILRFAISLDSVNFTGNEPGHQVLFSLKQLARLAWMTRDGEPQCLYLICFVVATAACNRFSNLKLMRVSL